MIPLTNPSEKSIKSCIQCGIEKPIISKGLCRSCYLKQWLKDNPEKYELRKQYARKKSKEWRLHNPEKAKEQLKKWKLNNPEHYKELRKAQNLRYIEKNPEYLKNLNEIINKARICKILREHAKEMKDDPEHLTTEFIQKLIGIKCKKSKSN